MLSIPPNIHFKWKATGNPCLLNTTSQLLDISTWMSNKCLRFSTSQSKFLILLPNLLFSFLLPNKWQLNPNCSRKKKKKEESTFTPLSQATSHSWANPIFYHLHFYLRISNHHDFLPLLFFHPSSQNPPMAFCLIQGKNQSIYNNVEYPALYLM